MKLAKTNRIIVVMFCLALGFIVPIHVQAAPKVKLNKYHMDVNFDEKHTILYHEMVELGKEGETIPFL